MRTRVASSDWCASRNVVSVTARAVCARRARAKPAGPSSRSRCRDPAGAGAFRSIFGSLSSGSAVSGRGPLGRLTVTSASQFSIFVPRSFDARPRKSSGRSSMNEVLTLPAMKSGSSSTACRNGMLVDRRGCGTRPAHDGHGSPRQVDRRPEGHEVPRHPVRRLRRHGRRPGRQRRADALRRGLFRDRDRRHRRRREQLAVLRVRPATTRWRSSTPSTSTRWCPRCW